MLTGNESVTPVVVPGFVYGDGSYESPSVKDGLTIRQHYAGLFMASLLANPHPDVQAMNDFPRAAVSWADDLITELNKQP